jgi:hypothetical protein
MRSAFITVAATLALFAAGPVRAQGQSQQMTQPSTTQNESQTLQNESQQPGNAKIVAPTAPVASENGVTKPQGPVTGATSQSPTRGVSK